MTDKQLDYFDRAFVEVLGTDQFFAEEAKIRFTKAIEIRMDRLGIGRAELAKRMETSKSYVTKILRGDANFTIESMVKVSRALDGDFVVDIRDTKDSVVIPNRMVEGTFSSNVVFPDWPRDSYRGESTGPLESQRYEFHDGETKTNGRETEGDPAKPVAA